MIHVSIQRDPFRMHRADRYVLEWSSAQTVRGLCPDDMVSRADLRAFVGAKRVQDLDAVLRDGDFVHYALMPGQGVGRVVAQFAIAVAQAYAISALFGAPDQAQERDDEASPTYGFNGIGNNRSEGLPIAVLYGRMRTGGQVISEWVQVLGTPAISTLHTIFAFGEGAIQDVGGVIVDTPATLPLSASTLPAETKISGNAADNFDDVEMWVRLGSNSQESVPGFDMLHTPHEVGQKLLAGEAGGSSPDIFMGVQWAVGDPFTTARDTFWAAGVAFDITTPSDGFTARIAWPGGLYWVNSQGNVFPAAFRGQFRYRELDGSNLPITTGGPNGDGWVRLRDENTHWAAERSPHEREYTHQFIDPQTWTVPQVGFALDSGTDGSNDGAEITWDGAYDSSTAIIPEFSVSFWMYSSIDLATDPDSTPDQGTIRNLVSNQLQTSPIPTTGYGIMIGVRTMVGLPGQAVGTSTHRIVAHLAGVEGTIVLAPSSYGQSRPPTFQGWDLITLTYKSGAMPNGDDRVRLYRDAQLEIEGSDTLGLSTATTIGWRLRNAATHQEFRVLNDKTGRNVGGIDGNVPFDGLIDDLCFYNEELSQQYITTRFDTRFTGPAHPAMVARWKFDDAFSAEQDINWPTLSQKDFHAATVFPAAGSTSTSGSVGGIVETSSTQSLKRMKARVELLRVDFDITHTSAFDDAEFRSITSLVDENLEYPNTALVAQKVRATDQLNTTQPVTTFLVRGRPLPHWNGVSDLSPDIAYFWSHNPAWASLDLILNERYGLGQFYTTKDVDLPSFKDWADYSDNVLYDGSAPDLATATASPATGDWDDIRYENTVTGPDPDDPGQTITRGMLRIVFALNVVPASNYSAGRFVILTGVNGTGEPGISIDINNTSGQRPLGGYEIIRGPYLNGTEVRQVVEVYWDRLAEGDPWTHNTLISAAITGGSPNLAGTMTTGEHRFAFNGVFDRLTTPWDALLDICAVGRAVPVREGKRIRIRYAHPQAPSALIARGSLLDGAFEVNYSGPSDKPNAMEISFLDEDLEYVRTPLLVLDPTLRDTNVTADVSQYRLRQHFLFGVTSRSQVERHGNFILNANRLLKRSGSFSMPVDGLHLEVNDVVYLSHDILPRGVGGRVADSALLSQTVVVLDQDFVIEPSVTYKLYIRDATQTFLDADGKIKDWEVADVTLISPGSYLAGTAVQVTNGPDVGTGGFSTVPVGNQTAYALVKSGDELIVEITGITQNEDLTREIEWTEYDAAVFVDDATQNTTSAFFDGGDGGAGTINSRSGNDIVGSDRVHDATVIDGPYNVSAKDLLARARGAGHGARVHVSWTYRSSEHLRLSKTVIHARVLRVPAQDSGVGPTTTNQPWCIVGEAQADATSVEVSVPEAAVGDAIEFAVRAISLGGTSRRPDRCAGIVHTYRGLGLIPPALVGAPTAEMDGSRVRYSWALDPSLDSAVVEVRRGGWVLGTPAYTSSPGATVSSLVEDVAGGINEQPALRFAARDAAGQYSAHTVLSFTPAPDVQSDAFPADDHTEAWEDWGDGWVTDSAPPAGDPLLSNLSRHADGHLEWGADVSLTGTYRTRNHESVAQTLDTSRSPITALIEASVIADQVHPRTWAEFTDGWGEPENSRWTWEGPTHLVGSESQCTIAIEWRFTKDGTTWSSEWLEFKPGVYDIVDCRFRLRVTRPTTGFDVQIRRFATRIRIVGRKTTDRTSRQAFLEGETF